MAETCRVRNSDTPLERLNYLHRIDGLSWRKIAALEPFCGIPPGTLCAISKGYPIPRRYRLRLGLPPETTIVVISGEVPPGSQSIAARRCQCGHWFIANHPRRKKCFICSPYRGK